MPGGQVLVTGLMVANQRYIELETLDTQEKQPARVVVVDYDADLALVEPLDAKFLAGRQPMDLSGDASIGDQLTVWQVKPNGDVIPDQGLVTSVDLSLFSLNNFFLTYRLNGSLQYGFNNQTLPVVYGDALAGLVLRQNTSGQTIEVIATPVIRHFLKDAQSKKYKGFPTAGFYFGALSDPQLRRYIGLPESLTGIYVQKVLKGSPADKAGLMAGDVITRIGDHEVTNNGQYNHPRYGQTSVVHLIRTGSYVGDPLAMRIYRAGKTLDLQPVLDHRQPDEYLVPPYILDRQPEYLIVGGLVFLELSMSYLREYGNDWVSDAPIHLLYYQQNQDYLNGDHREKIVIISDVIATPFSIGYENLSNLVVLKVNDQPIGKLDDVRKALKTPVNGFHKIEVQQHPKELFLDPKELPQIHKVIEQRYGIPIPPL
ncbi:MAG: PDZ domain-containing protein [Acidithiobacillus sp.]|nr:PDZ domain-containing protein [Acidithiobacillus sp.]